MNLATFSALKLSGKKSIRRILGPLLTEHLVSARYGITTPSRLRGKEIRLCPICGYSGTFAAGGGKPRYGARCRGCNSLERHRLFYLALQHHELLKGNEKVLYFAPEECLLQVIKRGSLSCISADLRPGQADIVLNIEKIGLDSGSIDLVIANQVLEHVDDSAGLREIHRVLRTGGRMAISVPLVEGWPETYEDPSITSAKDRTYYYGQPDHVRIFGRDFRDRVRNAGFSLEEFVGSGKQSAEHALILGERIFIGTKA